MEKFLIQSVSQSHYENIFSSAASLSVLIIIPSTRRSRKKKKKKQWTTKCSQIFHNGIKKKLTTKYGNEWANEWIKLTSQCDIGQCDAMQCSAMCGIALRCKCNIFYRHILLLTLQSKNEKKNHFTTTISTAMAITTITTK